MTILLSIIAFLFFSIIGLIMIAGYFCHKQNLKIHQDKNGKLVFSDKKLYEQYYGKQ